MANKKRMEQDPSIDPKTGKKRERRLKREDLEDRSRVTVNIDGSIDTTFFKMDPEILKQYEDEMRAMAEKMMADDDRDKTRPGGGNIFRDGEMSGGPSGAFRSIFGGSGPGSSFDASKFAVEILDSAEMKAMYGIPTRQEVNTIERSIWQTCMDVWNYPSGVRFTVWRQEAQASTLLHVEYMDPEQEAGALVEGTVEFRDEQLEEARGGPELIVQRELERLKDQCDADMAAFEPEDGEEGA